jgi:hypothetical protein
MADEAPTPEAAPASDAPLSDDAVAALAAAIEQPPGPEPEPDAETPVPEGEKPPGAADDPPAEEKPVEAKPQDEATRLRRLGAKIARRQAALDARDARIKQAEDKILWVDSLSRLPRHEQLKAIGINEDDVVDDVLKRAQKPPAPKTPQDEIAEIRAELAAERAKVAAEVKRQQDVNVYTVYRNGVVDQIMKAPGLEAIKARGDWDEVIANMGQYHARHGVVPDPVDVAEMINDVLVVAEARKNKNSPATGTPKKNQPPPTSKAKNSAAPSPSLTDRISDTATGDDDLPDDPDARLKVIWQRSGY